jgi:mRNA-degrading endonuclease YafQ of YafQ-DinJ toxin-antitoxin module
MRFCFSAEVDGYLRKLKRNDPKTFELVKKQLVLFESNPKHPSFRIHKLSGKLDGVWSLSIGLKFRLLYFIKDGEAWGYMIGTHDDVYKK